MSKTGSHTMLLSTFCNCYALSNVEEVSHIKLNVILQ